MVRMTSKWTAYVGCTIVHVGLDLATIENAVYHRSADLQFPV